MKKVLVGVLVVLAAAGISLGVVASGGGRPTPEQYLQSLVSQQLVWHKVNGAEVATDRARALTFEVRNGQVSVIIDAPDVDGLAHPTYTLNGDLGLAAEVIVHYAGPNAAFFAAIDFNYVFEQTVGAYGPDYWAIAGTNTAVVPAGTFQHRTVSVGLTSPKNPNEFLAQTYFFTVSAIQRAK